ncbi:MAG: methyltransferase domain-containing protein [Pyrinomonadaceae bacterium]
MMEFTGERFVPGERGQIKYEHLHRYALSMEFAAGKSVLDIASGEGYGAALLAQVAEVVTGVDIDPGSVNHAKRRYYYPNLHFSVGSCQSIPLPDQSVDLVTSFETIEHHEHHEDMMREIRRVLKPGGVLIISSPNRLVYSDEPQYTNPFHVKELYFDEFNKLLGQHFHHLQLYGQRLSAGSFIYPVGEARASVYKAFTGDDDSLRRQVVSLPAPLYFIAVCSNNPLGDHHAIDSVYIDELDDLMKIPETERANLIEVIESRARQSEEEIAAQRAMFETRIDHLTGELARAQTQYEAQLNLEREQSFAKDRRLEEATRRLRDSQQSLHEKEQELALSELKIEEYSLQMRLKDQLPELLEHPQQAEGLELRQQFAKFQLALEPKSFDDATLLQDIERQLNEREPSLRAKDLQLEEMEQRMRTYNQAFEKFEKSSFYRLGRILTWPLRKIKRS